MSAFYNEPDPYAAQWLRNLIAAGHIASGIVSEKDIRDITPGEIAEFTQCHFFAGIGVWSYALRRAGWLDDRPIWTGSCPCQPFSAAGNGAGFDDERHLWPAWHTLVAQCRPAIILGEQVASKDGLKWLDLVSSDLEGTDYAVGASDLCAAGFGGAHLRQRLYFVGLADARRRVGVGRSETSERHDACATLGQQNPAFNKSCGEVDRVVYGQRAGLERYAGDGDGSNGRQDTAGPVAAPSDAVRLAHADGGLTGTERQQCSGEYGQPPTDNSVVARAVFDPGAPYAGWDWLLCRNPAGEPSWRPVEPGTFPLDHAATSRMGRLRAYGNGLDAETATGFIQCVMDVLS